jgi:hypothetical protein
MISMDFFAFFTRFSTQKTFLSQRDHSPTIRLADAQLKMNAGLTSQKFVFYAFQSGKK